MGYKVQCPFCGHDTLNVFVTTLYTTDHDCSVIHKTKWAGVYDHHDNCLYDNSNVTAKCHHCGRQFPLYDTILNVED